jgi:DNA polymerase-3 subunit delta'
VLAMRPLAQSDVACALAASVGSAENDPQIDAAAAAADGSVARALAFLDEDALALRQRALEELERLPTLNAHALHALGDALVGTDPRPLGAFVDTVNAWLSRNLDQRGAVHGGLPRLDRLAEAWERINAAARDAETYNLERKPLVFSVFGLLAEATRG